MYYYIQQMLCGKYKAKSCYTSATYELKYLVRYPSKLEHLVGLTSLDKKGLWVLYVEAHSILCLGALQLCPSYSLFQHLFIRNSQVFRP
jgi:hypothetical protein